MVSNPIDLLFTVLIMLLCLGLGMIAMLIYQSGKSGSNLEKNTDKERPGGGSTTKRSDYATEDVQKFMELFIKIFDNMKTYWKTEKPNAWDYFFNKVLKALGISYVSYKMLQEQEEEQKRIEEENERKRKEEMENEEKQREMMAFLEKQTGEKNIEKRMEEDFKKEQEELETKKDEKERGKSKKDTKKKK